MSYSASQFEDLIDAIHRKNGKTPSKDQAELLEKDESWIHQLRKRPHGAANVPNYVLQTVTAAHEVRVKRAACHAVQPAKDAERQVARSSSSRGTPESSPERHVPDQLLSPDEGRPSRDGMPITSVQSVKNAQREVPKPSLPHGAPERSPDRHVSDWSASSDEDRPRRDGMPESSVVEETPYPPHTRAAYRRAPLDFVQNKRAFALPSQEEEEELEVQLPCGENERQNDASENPFMHPHRVASQRTQQNPMQLTNTPSCAHPDHDFVPATVTAESTGRAEVDKRRRPVKRFKPINLGSDSPIKPKGDDMDTRGSRMQSLNHLEVTETQDTLVSSSIVAATPTQTQTQDATGTAQESGEAALETMAGMKNSASAAEEAQSSSEELLSAKSHLSNGLEGEQQEQQEQHEQHEQHEQGQASMGDSKDQAKTPFTEFSAIYSDYSESYNGTDINFVKACLCLEHIRGKRALREYLYDDFIRLFSYEFLHYVNDARSDQEPLPAIEWFNMQKGQPLYNREIVNNDNLDNVLSFYEQEVAEIRAHQQQYEREQTPEVTVVLEEKGLESATPAPLPEEVQDSMEVDGPNAEITQSGAVTHQVPAQEKVLDERPISRVASPNNALVDRRVSSTCQQAIRVARSARSPQAVSPQLGSRTASGVPPSSMRSNAPVASQYMQRLATRSASSSEDAARQHRERMRAALRRRRASASARSLSSKAGSVA